MPASAPQSIENHIHALTVGEKIRLAHCGNREARSILARDTNRKVASVVVQSETTTRSEVISFANNKALSYSVVRETAANRKHLWAYPVKAALANNPKTPVRGA